MTISDLSTIERKTLIRAPRSRVWRALTDPHEFAKWFKCEFTGAFTPGKRLDMVSTHPCGQGAKFYLTVDRIDPERTFSWRWSPGAPKEGEDRSGEEETRVEFQLEDAENGTLVTVRETGFDRISLARRAKAFEDNQKGWEIQMQSLERYVTEAA